MTDPALVPDDVLRILAEIPNDNPKSLGNRHVSAIARELLEWRDGTRRLPNWLIKVVRVDNPPFAIDEE